MHGINQRISQLRLQRQLTMSKLAELIGVSPGNISDWESDKKKSTPTANALVAIAQCFDVSLDWLMTGKDRTTYTGTVFSIKNTNPIIESLTKHASTLPVDDLTVLDTLAAKLADYNSKLMPDYSELPSQSAVKNGKMTIREASLATEYYVKLPLVGKVTAGAPITAIENIEEYFTVPRNMLTAGATHFILRVRGESMINSGIEDNDMVVVRQQPNAENGDIVVALIDNEEATVKTFYKEDGHIRLQPENNDFKPIILSDVAILGKVVSVLRDAE